MKALGQAIAAVAATSDVAPAQVFVGWPTSTKLSDIFGKASKQALISVWPLKGKNTTRYKPILEVTQQPTAGVTAVINGNTLTVGGAPKAGDVVHAFFANPARDAAYLVAANDTPAIIATALAAAANAYALPGVSAVSLGEIATLTGATFSKVNIGGTGQFTREVGRIERIVQVTVWANDPDACLDLADAISTNIGNAQQPFITCDDGTAMRVECQSDGMNDAAQSSYSTFKSDILFLVEYGRTQVVVGTQVGGTQYSQSYSDTVPLTAYYG
jgi:hypothetical protein